MKKYIFSNANAELNRINLERNINQDIPLLSRFSKIVLGIFLLIYLINLILLWCDSTYINFIYEQINYIIPKYVGFCIELNESPVGSFVSQKERIVMIANFFVTVIIFAPFLIEAYINENKQVENKNVN